MKPNILNRFLITQVLAAICITSAAYAATATKAATGTDLTAAASWSGGSGPGFPTSDDVATWTPTSLGPGLTVPSDVAWGSINITGATGAIAISDNGNITTGNITLAGSQTLSITNFIVLSGNSIYNIADVTGSSAADATLSGVITGEFGITKSGAGTLVLSSGSSDYTGATTVNAGTLNFSGALASSISVGSGATLTGTGGITSGDITFNAGSNVIPVVSSPVKGANVAVNATTNIFVTSAPSGAPATVGVVEHTGSITGLGNFSATNYRAGSISDTAGVVSLTYTGEAKTWSDAAGTWDVGTASQWTGGSDTKFYWGDSVAFGAITADRAVTLTGKLAPTSVTVSNTANTYTFSGTGGITGPCSLTKSGAGTLTLSTANTFTGATTVSGGQLNVTGSGTLGTGALAMSGVTLDLGGTNQAVGPVSVTAGSTIQNGSLTGTSYAVSNGTGTTATISANLLASGAAGLAKSGTGTLVLSGANTYTGPTTIGSGGSVTLSGGDNRLATTGTVNFTGTNTLILGSNQQTLDSVTITGGAINATVSGSSGSKLTLTGATLNVGSATSNGLQQLLMGGTTQVSNFVYDNAAGTVNVTNTFATASAGSSVITLGTTNVITASEINIGRFSMPAAANNNGSNINMGQTNTLNADTITIGSGERVAGALQYSSNNSPSLTIRGTAGGTTRANMLLGSQAGPTASAALAGTVNLVQFITGTSTVDARLGTLTIGQNVRTTSIGATSTSNCNGVFRMGAGTVDATTILLGQDTNGFDTTNATGSVTNATFTTDITGAVITGFGLVKVNTLTMGDKRGTSTKMTLNSIFNLNNGGVLQAGTIADGSTAATTVTRTINWNDGTIKNYDSGTDLSITSTATGAAAITLKLAATGSHTFDIDASRTATVSAVLADATSLGTLVKSGNGTLTLLNGTSTYSGTTTVNSGKLLANNATGSATGTGSVTVKSTATFGGTGSVSGAVNLESGGTLAPGASIGALATGALTVPAGATLAAELSSSGTPTVDSVNVTGNLTLGGALNVTDIAGAPAPIPLLTKLTLISYTGTHSGEFTGKPEGSTFAVGSNTFKIRYNDASKVTLEAVSAGSGYSGWASANAPSQTAGQDFDNDGVSNGAEWVLGGLASTNDVGKLPTVSTALGNLTFTFKRDQASKTAGTAVSIQVGTSLATWTTYPVPDSGTDGPVTVTPNGDGTDTVKLTVAQGADTKKFARLNVVITP